MILDRLDKLAAREKIGLVIAVCFAVALISDWLVVRKMQARYRDLDVRIRTMEGDVIENRAILRSKDRVLGDYERIKDALGQVTSSDEAVSDMKGEIDDLARRAGVALQSVEHREPVRLKGGACEAYSVVVGGFEADARSVADFLADVQKSPGMLRVEKLTISPGKAKNSIRGSMLLTKVMVTAQKP